jgi:hypothetical protein
MANNNLVTIYFGKYINNNTISLNILNDDILKFLNQNFEIKHKFTKKIYQHNNLFYEIKNNKHKCYKKNNFKSKEIKKNNIAVQIYNYERKNIELDIFPSLLNYLNEEEQQIIQYGNNIELVKGKNFNYIVLNKNDFNLIDKITKILN